MVSLKIRFFCILLLLWGMAGCSTPQSRYETTTEKIHVVKAPEGTTPLRVALVQFRDLTGKKYLVEPATAQLTSLMLQSGYFAVVEPSLIESVIRDQSEITPEKLSELKERYDVDYFLTGTLTEFEIRETESGFCLLLGLLGGYGKKEYVVEAGIDYRLVTVPDAKIRIANVVSSKRTNTSQFVQAFLSAGGSEIKVKQSSGGKLLRYALADMIRQIVSEMN